MTRGVFYVIGAGLAGLAAAVELATQGKHVQVIESAPQAGGRCRSWFDANLDDTIDNGNHLVLSANRAVFAYLKAIGSENALTGPREARFAFCDIRTDTRWTVGLSPGRIPWWVLLPSRRAPGTSSSEYGRFAPLLLRNRGRAVKDVVRCEGAVWEKLLRPFLLAALNTAPEDASAELASSVLRETLARGGRFCLPRIAVPSLAAAFVEPAISFLHSRGARICLGERLRAVEENDSAAAALSLADYRIELTPPDRVILAVPSWIATDLLPGILAPDQSSAIVNAHFRISAPEGAPQMMGVLGGTAEWVFSFPRRISVTVSGADAIVDLEREQLARILWRDVAAGYGLPAGLPPWQIVKEKRATFRATPDQAAKRAGVRTRLTNLFLAGDWTDTGLPATIEGAIRSGRTTAQFAIAST